MNGVPYKLKKKEKERTAIERNQRGGCLAGSAGGKPRRLQSLRFLVLSSLVSLKPTSPSRRRSRLSAEQRRVARRLNAIKADLWISGRYTRRPGSARRTTSRSTKGGCSPLLFPLLIPEALWAAGASRTPMRAVGRRAQRLCTTPPSTGMPLWPATTCMFLSASSWLHGPPSEGIIEFALIMAA